MLVPVTGKSQTPGAWTIGNNNRPGGNMQGAAQLTFQRSERVDKLNGIIDRQNSVTLPAQ